MFDMQAYMRVYLRAYRTELRQRRLCIECAEISERFTRCRHCRVRQNRRKKARRVVV